MDRKNQILDGQGMYFDPQIAKLFVDRERDHEHNKEHIGTSKIFESIILYIIKTNNLGKNIKIASLGAGSNPDEYNKLVNILGNNSFDWVDSSTYMLEMAQKYVNFYDENVRSVFNFVEADFMKYLQDAEDESLDIIFMQYTFNLVDDLKDFFDLVNRKLKKGGYFISDVNLYPNGIKPESANALYGINGKTVTEITYPKEGDIINLYFRKQFDSKDVLCSMNIVYHSKESIMSCLDSIAFEYTLYENWEENYDYLKQFLIDEFNASLRFSRAKPFLIVKKI